MPWTALHRAAAVGDMAVIQRILEASPGDAMVADDTGWHPLHVACTRGRATAVELLPSAAPQAASVADGCGWLPLHWAALNGHGAVIELLLGTAPETERARTAAGKTALSAAASQGHLPAARVLLERSTAETPELIADLLAALHAQTTSLVAPEKRQQVAHALLADLAARRALLPADWGALLTPCAGLAHALPAVLGRSPAEAAQLVAHLPAEERSCLRTLALSLARVQRRLRLEMPEGIVRRILVAAPLEE
eukprot:scaffold8.g1729.t1